MFGKIGFYALGLFFGLIMSRSGASDYDYIQRMFLLEDLQLFGIIGGAIVFGAPALFWLRKQGRTHSGEPVQWSTKRFHGGIVPGGILFGIGWSMTGMCPAPILVNIGEGKWIAVAAFAGAVLGALLFGILQPRLNQWLKLSG